MMEGLILFFAVIGTLILVVVVLYNDSKKIPPAFQRKKTQYELEQELYERIMREGSDEQKLVALQYRQNQNLEALRGLVLFDIFFN